MVTVLPFYSEDPNSNPNEVYHYYVKFLSKQTKMWLDHLGLILTTKINYSIYLIDTCFKPSDRPLPSTNFLTNQNALKSIGMA